MGVFHADQGGNGVVDVGHLHSGAHSLFGHGAPHALHGPAHQIANGGHAAHLVELDVRGLLADDLAKAGVVVGVGEDGDQVAHGAAGQKERGFLAGFLGRKLFQAVDAGVFAKHVVAHFGGGHSAAHGFGGLGNSIASQVDGHGGLLHKRVRMGLFHCTPQRLPGQEKTAAARFGKKGKH